MLHVIRVESCRFTQKNLTVKSTFLDTANVQRSTRKVTSGSLQCDFYNATDLAIVAL